MELPTVGTVAFVIALVTFFTTQFGLKDKRALLCVFIIALLFNLAPLIIAAFPHAAPFIDVFLKTILLFISAAGGYDFTMKTVTKINAPQG